MTDDKIIRLYFERSEKAIEETEKEYGHYFHYIAYGILGDDEDAKEIVSDTYLRAWNTIPPERPRHLKAFLGSITRQLSINRLEQKTAQKRGGGQYFLALDELEECIPSNDSGKDSVELIALQDLLQKFLRSISAESRCVFIRRYWHMHPISEIAREYCLSESKVKSMLMRARKKLKKYLSEEGFDL